MPNRQNKKGRSKTDPFVMLPYAVMDSPGFQALSAQCVTVYLQLRRKFKGNNNGFLGLSVREAAARCNISKDTARVALRQLVECGLIEIAQEGAFSYKLRHSAEYRLTDYRCDKTGKAPSRAYLAWAAAGGAG